MEELSTLLVVFGSGAIAGVVGTVILSLLVGIFLNTRKRENDDEEALVIPYSALASGMGGGPPQQMTMADVLKMRAAYAAAQGEAPPGDKKKDEKTPEIGGNYL